MKILKTDYKKFGLFISLFLFLENVSLLGFFNPVFLKGAFLILSLLFLAISLYRIKYGLLFLLMELIIGSKGYLLYFPLTSENLISFRIVIWSLFILIFFVKLILQLKKDGKNSLYWQNIINFPLLKPLLIFFATLALGVLSAFIYNNELLNIFFDFNNWLYFLLIFPLIAIYPSKKELSLVIFASVFWVSAKTLLLLGVFSQNALISSEIYHWLRKTLVGEMTILDGWNRVFIQSQIFILSVYLILLAKSREISFALKRTNIGNWLLIISGGLFFSSIVVSLSRSFWVGFFAALLFVFGYFIFKEGFKKVVKPLKFLLVTAIIGVAFIFIAIPLSSSSQLDNQLASRVTSGGGKDEAAVASRWALLKPLSAEIIKNPITGQGFGATVSYYSQDPRVLEESGDGYYTTYAFEWGYFDIWLKIGLIGLLAYLWFLWKIVKVSFSLAKNDYFYLGLTSSVLMVAAVHFFTPYLNHPLGIGIIIISSCFIFLNRVY